MALFRFYTGSVMSSGTLLGGSWVVMNGVISPLIWL